MEGDLPLIDRKSNPIAFGLALSHFSLSTCRSAAFPERGLIIMLVAVLRGFMMRIKLLQAVIRQRVLKIHARSVLSISAILILVIRHAMVDWDRRC